MFLKCVRVTLNLSLLLINLILFMFFVLGTFDKRYAFLLEIENKAMVINMSVIGITFLGMWLIFYALQYIWTRLKCRLIRKKFAIDNDFFYFTAIFVNVLITLSWISFTIFQIYIYKNGHVPAIDLLYRTYDVKSVCWGGYRIEYVDINSIQLNCLDLTNNVVVRNNAVQKKCAICRSFIKPNEPTFFNQNYNLLMLMAVVMITFQLWNLYGLLKWRQKINKNNAEIINEKNNDYEIMEWNGEAERYNDTMNKNDQIEFLLPPPPPPMPDVSPAPPPPPPPPLTTNIYNIPKPVKCTCLCYICSCSSIKNPSPNNNIKKNFDVYEFKPFQESFSNNLNFKFEPIDNPTISTFTTFKPPPPKIIKPTSFLEELKIKLETKL